MYGWIWHKLPGRWPAKLAGAAVLVLAALALLFFFVFPWAEERVPFNDVTVPQEESSAPAAPGG